MAASDPCRAFGQPSSIPESGRSSTAIPNRLGGKIRPSKCGRCRTFRLCQLLANNFLTESMRGLTLKERKIKNETYRQKEGNDALIGLTLGLMGVAHSKKSAVID